MRPLAVFLMMTAVLASGCGGREDGGSAATPPDRSIVPSAPASSHMSPSPLDDGLEPEAPEMPMGVELGPPMTGHDDPISGLRFTVADGDPVAVSGSLDGTVRVWNLLTREQAGDPIVTESPVVSLTLGELDGDPFMASVSANATRPEVHSLSTGEELAEFGVNLGSFPLTVAADPAGSSLVVGGSDRTVHIIDGTTGGEISGPLEGHGDSIHGSAFTTVDGEKVAITTGDDESLILWDPHEGRRIGDPIDTWHREWVRAVAAGEVDGVPVAVTGSFDHDLRLFDLVEHQQIGDPLVGHTDAVTCLDVGEVNGLPVAISGSRDSTVRLWNLRTRQQIGDPFITHLGKVGGVALGEIDGRSIALSGGEHGAVQVWDLSAIADES